MLSKTLFTTFVAGLAALAKAQDLFDPSSNPTKTPAIGEVVPAGVAYTLSWTPTTTGPVSIQLLTGSAPDLLVPGAFVAQGIANSGSVSWTPTNDLAAFAVVGYKVIDVATGKFQYSVPFKVGKGADTTPSPSPTPSKTPTGYPTYTPPSSYKPTTVPTTAYPTYTPKPSGTAPGYNSTVIYPTGSLTVPTSLKTSSTATGTSKPTEFPGAATARKAGLGLVGAVAGLVLML